MGFGVYRSLHVVIHGLWVQFLGRLQKASIVTMGNYPIINHDSAGY